MTRGVRGISVGYPLRYPLRGVVYPLGLKILLIRQLTATPMDTKSARTTHAIFSCSRALKEPGGLAHSQHTGVLCIAQ